LDLTPKRLNTTELLWSKVIKPKSASTNAIDLVKTCLVFAYYFSRRKNVMENLLSRFIEILVVE